MGMMKSFANCEHVARNCLLLNMVEVVFVAPKFPFDP